MTLPSAAPSEAARLVPWEYELGGDRGCAVEKPLTRVRSRPIRRRGSLPYRRLAKMFTLCGPLPTECIKAHDRRKEEFTSLNQDGEQRQKAASRSMRCRLVTNVCRISSARILLRGCTVCSIEVLLSRKTPPSQSWARLRQPSSQSNARPPSGCGGLLFAEATRLAIYGNHHRSQTETPGGVPGCTHSLSGSAPVNFAWTHELRWVDRKRVQSCGCALTATRAQEDRRCSGLGGSIARGSSNQGELHGARRCEQGKGGDVG